MSLDDFYTATEADEGVKLPLYDKFGEATDEWLKVRGVDSDTFRNAKIDADRKSLTLVAEDDDVKRRLGVLRIKREVTAALISDWSDGFREQIGEPTIDNICGFFEKAPQVMDLVDQFAGNRRLFFSHIKNSSASGSKDTPS